MKKKKPLSPAFPLLGAGLAALGIAAVAFAVGHFAPSPAPVAYAASSSVKQGQKTEIKGILDAPKSPSLPPNELGRIPILMYHSVGDPPLTGSLAKFNHLGLSIPASLFRKHLEVLHDAGFYPVNVRDLFSPDFSVPAGKTPVALTFDDARASQFRYHKDGSLDPNCVIGILEEFHKKHPDWPERATFYVLPDSKYNPAPFGQKPLVKKKVEYLISHGYEIANHSTSHRPMSRMDAHTLAWEMNTCAQYFLKFSPQATMETMALPYGITPSSKALSQVLLGSSSAGYHNKCILLAAGNPSYAPSDKRFDATRIPRVGSEPGNIERFIRILASGRHAAAKGTKPGEFPPYISDGDPTTVTVPAPFAKYLNKNRLGSGQRLVVYAVPPPASSKTGLKKVASRPLPTQKG